MWGIQAVLFMKYVQHWVSRVTANEATLERKERERREEEEEKKDQERLEAFKHQKAGTIQPTCHEVVSSSMKLITVSSQQLVQDDSSHKQDAEKVPCSNHHNYSDNPSSQHDDNSFEVYSNGVEMQNQDPELHEH